MNTTSKLISIKQASQLLGVTPLTLRNWDKNGKLKALRHPMNNYRVYKREEVEKLIESIGSNTAPTPPARKAKGPLKLQVKHLDD
jgi:excisionase family DNA binding protein